MLRRLLALVVAMTALWSCRPEAAVPPPEQDVAPQEEGPRQPDVIYLPTRENVADGMLRLAGVTAGDIVYDLGSGDGRIVIQAARTFGARGVGIDIDPERVSEARANAAAAGVTDRVRFIEGDIFDPAVSIREATVVALYLLPSLNQKLMPRLTSELAPGTRVVSNSFDMGRSWPPDRTDRIGSYTIYLWVIPDR